MLWHEQSWPTLAALDKNTPVIIPLGSMEQHGKHLPVLVDTIQVQAIADAAEKRLGNKALFLPALWLGSSHHHADFTGTVSVMPSLYCQMIQQMVMCVVQAGFQRVVLLNGHGGNHVPISHAITELNIQDDRANDALIVLATWWQAAGPAIKADKMGMTTPQISHACEYETSLLLALRPELVKMDRIVQGAAAMDNGWFHTEYGGRVQLMQRFRTMSAAGSMGNPSAATADKGRRLLDAVVGEVTRFIEELATWPLPRRLGPA